MHAQIEKVLGRVAALLEEETAQIKAGSIVGLPSFAKQKELLAFELAHMLAISPEQGMDDSRRRRHGVIRGKVQQNLAVLKAQLAAVEEIAALLLLIRDAADSDGTYTVSGATLRKPS